MNGELDEAPQVVVAVMNAHLGKGIGLHGQDLVRAVFASAVDQFQALPSIDQDVPNFMQKVQEACYGVGETHGTGPRKRFPGNNDVLFKCASGKDCFTEPSVSTVMSFSALRSCMSDSDFARLFWRGVNNDTGATDDTPLNRDRWQALQDLSQVRREARRFRLDPAGLGLGNPVLWIAPTSGVEAVLAGVAREEWADTLRDRLGLFFPAFKPEKNKNSRARNRRFVVHIPARDLTPSCHARPCFADAAGYPRFMVESATASLGALRDWGQTTDLRALADRGALGDGLQERICRRIESVALGGTELRFDYLGEITCERGNTPLDDDVKFATLLRDLLTILHPSIAAELTAKGALEASVAPP